MEPGHSSLERHELALEEHILLAASTVDECGMHGDTKIINVAQHGHHRSDSASPRNQNDPPVLTLIKAKLSVGTSSLNG